MKTHFYHNVGVINSFVLCGIYFREWCLIGLECFSYDFSVINKDIKNITCAIVLFNHSFGLNFENYFRGEFSEI